MRFSPFRSRFPVHQDVHIGVGDLDSGGVQRLFDPGVDVVLDDFRRTGCSEND